MWRMCYRMRYEDDLNTAQQMEYALRRALRRCSIYNAPDSQGE